ncbi:MAG: polysaccharide biosynthesis protein [Acidobacteria bacterium]|nr:polysaccharide biosynthesis protein [Acidobacteriota bacterium]
MNFLFNRYVILLLDAFFSLAAFWLSFFVRSEFQTDILYKEHFYHGIIPVVVIQTAVFLLLGTHKLSLLRITFEDSVRLLTSIAVGAGAAGGFLYFSHPSGYPRSIFVLYPMILAGLVISLRFFGRFAHEERHRTKKKAAKPTGSVMKSIIIAGAGTSGVQLVRALRHQNRIRIVGFLDDDPLLQGKELCNLPILGRTEDVIQIAAKVPFQEIIIAMPSASGDRLKRLLGLLRPLGVPIKTMPNLTDFVEGKNPATQLRSINLEDLLRRDPVILDLSQIERHLRGNCVLVTGAAGSIGSELCRQIVQFMPDHLLLVDVAESPLYEIECELKERFPELNCTAVLLDLRDRSLLNDLFASHEPQIVFHAAAYKHVPMVELNPKSGIINNIEGGKNVADLALEFQCERFILISTDKAVNPTNLMGATKRVLEKYILGLNGRGNCRFITVRFGNVLGSKGSLIPIFERQLKQGGPLTVTHPEITRFFMTIPEATQLVLQAASMGRGGEIFVLDMGEPVRIMEIARDFIELHGFEVGIDVDIAITGLRPGEKLFEELFAINEAQEKTSHKKILMAKQSAQVVVDAEVDRLIESATSQNGDIASVLKAIVPEYQPTAMDPPEPHLRIHRPS